MSKIADKAIENGYDNYTDQISAEVIVEDEYDRLEGVLYKDGSVLIDQGWVRKSNDFLAYKNIKELNEEFRIIYIG